MKVRPIGTLPWRGFDKARWMVKNRRAAWQAAREPKRLYRKRMRMYARFVEKGDLVFDVGANVGSRVEAFIALQARVVAIEPLPDCAQHLRDTFTHDCVVVEMGLAATEGESTIRRGPYDWLSTMSDRWVDAMCASGRLNDDMWTDSIVVGVTTLDRLIAAHGVPSFTKIDVEGYEPEVLEGLSTALPALSFEYAPEMVDNARRCIARLEQLAAYRYAFSAWEGMVLGPWLAPDDILGWIAARGADDMGDIYAKVVVGP